MEENFKPIRIQIVEQYVTLLGNGEIDALIRLFSEDGKVHSPIYGTMIATEFYHKLAEDTNTSELKINGIFTEDDDLRIALYFNYKWTLRSGAVVFFDVVDIITFNEDNMITDLRIIYDTQQSRRAVAAFNKESL